MRAILILLLLADQACAGAVSVPEPSWHAAACIVFVVFMLWVRR